MSTQVADRTTRLSFPRVVRSEWIKLISLRSTWITLGAILVIVVGVASIAAATYNPDRSGGGRAAGPPGGFSTDPLSLVLTGSNLALLVIAVLGAVIGAREYSSGMVRSSMAAVPKRLSVLWAKLITFAGLIVPVVLVGILAAFLAGMRILRAGGFDTLGWSDDGVMRTVIGTAGYLIGLGLMGLAFGVLLRNLAGSIAIIIGGVLFLPALASALLPHSWSEALKYLPSNAANAFSTRTPPSDTLSLGPAIGVYAAWVVAVIIAAAITLRARDV